MVDVFAFVSLGIQYVGGLFRDANADGKGAPRSGATLCKMIITHWCKPLNRGAVGLNGLLFVDCSVVSDDNVPALDDVVRELASIVEAVADSFSFVHLNEEALVQLPVFLL